MIDFARLTNVGAVERQVLALLHQAGAESTHHVIYCLDHVHGAIHHLQDTEHQHLNWQRRSCTLPRRAHSAQPERHISKWPFKYNIIKKSVFCIINWMPDSGESFEERCRLNRTAFNVRYNRRGCHCRALKKKKKSSFWIQYSHLSAEPWTRRWEHS